MFSTPTILSGTDSSKKPRWSNLPGLMRPVSSQNGESEAVAVALIDDVKLALRITSSAFDNEITGLIEAAKADLQLSGVHQDKVKDEGDPLIRRAITVYCKAHFGFDNPEAERFQQSYDMLKAHLTLSAEYTQAPAVSDGAT